VPKNPDNNFSLLIPKSLGVKRPMIIKIITTSNKIPMKFAAKVAFTHPFVILVIGPKYPFLNMMRFMTIVKII
jgi:hypothetical protein